MSIQRWSVGMTTAPRRVLTLEASVRSVFLAGWHDVRLFAEPGTKLPADFVSLGRSDRDEKLGAFSNWYLALSELYLRTPHADAFMVLQDDVVLARGLREYLDNQLWPDPKVGVVSLYCPSHVTLAVGCGFGITNEGWGWWGALALVFSNPGIRAFLSDIEVLNHRHHGPDDGSRNIDSVVGAWSRRSGLPFYVHCPSLVSHIGGASTIWGDVTNTGRRRESAFNVGFLQRGVEGQ
ncbi:hypothetical protein [Rubinisphaera margarita]|uniref:hypothetical protein n=1 Tax=Rubinisphaera margarita TaxID=2909586 RepID=UPI001EE829E8|nr:hypothetical protein [Rubinisphaera margarita]MCG6154357.1 hypothetical protein [Rubinisphaera margarita]